MTLSLTPTRPDRGWLMPLIFLLAALHSPAQAEEPTASRQAELVHLVRQDCGSCHGMTLKGGLGPALLPDALRDKPADSLSATIYHGRPGTAMPPWRRFLNEKEADWIVQQLLQGFPEAH